MVGALLRVLTEEQRKAIHRRRVMLGENSEAVRDLWTKKSPEGDQLMAEE